MPGQIVKHQFLRGFSQTGRLPQPVRKVIILVVKTQNGDEKFTSLGVDIAAGSVSRREEGRLNEIDPTLRILDYVFK